MTDKQIKILQNNGYEIINSLNYIRKRDNDYPLCFINYNNKHNKFELNILKFSSSSIYKIEAYKKELDKIINLYKQLCN